MKKIEIRIFADIDENTLDIEEVEQTLQEDLYQICGHFDVKTIDLIDIID